MTQPLSHLQNMRREKYCAPRGTDLGQVALEQMACRRVQAYKGLIQHQQPGLPDEGGDQCQLLFHAVGIASDGAAQAVRQLERAGVFLYAPAPLPRGDAIQIGNEIQVLNSGKELIKIRIIRQKSGHLLGSDGLAADIMPVNGDRSLGKVQHTGHRPERGGLPRPIVPQKSEDLSCGHMEAQIVNCPFPSGICYGKV